MKSLKEFLGNFFKNQGQFVFFSLLIAKVCAFGISVFTIRFLPTAEFGGLTIVVSVFSIFAAFSGLGSQQSLLRYGSMEQDPGKKADLAQYLFKTGFYYQIILSVLFIISSLFFISKFEGVFLVFVFFSIRLIGFYFLNHIQSELRITGKNREFARVNNTVNGIGAVITVALTYQFQLTGFLIATAFTPYLSLFWYKKTAFRFKFSYAGINTKELWYYGLHSSGTALMSDALYALDILLLGFLLNENAVAHYKVAILIPTNLTFLAITFMQSDFPVLAKNCQNKVFLRNYIRNYYKIFIPLCIAIFVIGFALKDFILNLFFGTDYLENDGLFVLFLFIFCFNMLFRNLYGNLLSAVGKMKINTAVSFSALIILSVSALILTPLFGINGMGISLTLTLIFTGFTLMLSFRNYFKKLN